MRRVWKVTFVLAGVVALLAAGGGAQASDHSRRGEAVRGPVKALDVQNDAGHVVVRSGKQTTVRADEHARFFDPTVTVRNNNGVLTVRGSCPNLIVLSFLNDCSVDFTITIPEQATVKAVVSAGNIAVSDLESSQQLTTGSGAIRVRNVAADSVMAGTATGAITLAEVRVAKVVAKTSSGSITIDNAVRLDAISARTSSGAIDIAVPDGRYDITLKSSSGRTRIEGLKDDPKSPRKIDAASSSGSILVRDRDPKPGDDRKADRATDKDDERKDRRPDRD